MGGWIALLTAQALAATDKAQAEEMLLAEIRKHLDDLPAGEKVMLKVRHCKMPGERPGDYYKRPMLR